MIDTAKLIRYIIYNIGEKGVGDSMSEDGEDGTLDTETRPVTDRETKYLIGTGGATRRRLEQFSRTTLSIDGERGKTQTLVIKGTGVQRDLAVLAVNVMLQQMDNSDVNVDYEDLENRYEHMLDSINVPKDQVGTLIGCRGETMRTMEQETKTFMFLKPESASSTPSETKRLYILGAKKDRTSALSKVHSILEGLKSSAHHSPSPRPNQLDRADRTDRTDDRLRDARRDRHDDRIHVRMRIRDDRIRDDRLHDDRHVRRLTEYERFDQWRRDDEWRRYNDWLKSNMR